MSVSNPYHKVFPSTDVDPYRICVEYGITHPAIMHALKKLLGSGSGDKTREQELVEARDSIDRYFEMIEEEVASTHSSAFPIPEAWVIVKMVEGTVWYWHPSMYWTPDRRQAAFYHNYPIEQMRKLTNAHFIAVTAKKMFIPDRIEVIYNDYD